MSPSSERPATSVIFIDESTKQRLYSVDPTSSAAVIVPPVVDTSDDSMGPPRLSGHEREVLAWFAQGQSCTDIAARLGLSIQAVHTYRARLLRTLQLSTTAGLIRYAIQHETGMTMPVPAEPTPSPVTAPAGVVPRMSAPVPIVHRSHRIQEREEWPG